MWRNGALPLLLVCVNALTGNAQAQEAKEPGPEGRMRKIIYGDDDRMSEHHTEYDASQISDLMRGVGSASTVALISDQMLVYDATANIFVGRSDATTLGEAKGLCSDADAAGNLEQFRSQPNPASCSGTVVQWNEAAGTGLVATAGHCLDDDGQAWGGCQNFDGSEVQSCPFTFAFDFTDQTVSDDGGFALPAANVYACSGVTLCHVAEWGEHEDYALLRITRDTAALVEVDVDRSTLDGGAARQVVAAELMRSGLLHGPVCDGGGAPTFEEVQALCPAEVAACLSETACSAELEAALAADEEPPDMSDLLTAIAECYEVGARALTRYFEPCVESCLEPEFEWLVNRYSSDEMEMAADRSCEQLGWATDRGSPWVCSESDLAHDGTVAGSDAQCHGADNSETEGHTHAASICQDVGARLCTLEEIQAEETRGTGCGHDNDQVWTSSLCEDGFYSAQGSGRGSVVCNADLAANHAVRCCSDVSEEFSARGLGTCNDGYGRHTGRPWCDAQVRCSIACPQVAVTAE